MKQTIFLLLFLPAQLIAQSIFVKPIIGYGKTQINNKEDKKSSNDSLWMTGNSFKPNFGIEVGASFWANRISISTGINRISIAQNYEGVYSFPLSSTTQKTELNYLSIPLNVSFSFNTEKQFQPYLQFDAQYNHLYSYSHVYDAKYKTSSTSIEYSHNRTYKNEKLTETVSGGSNPLSSDATIKNWLFKRNVISLGLSLGFNYKINEKIAGFFQFNAMQSVGDIENKEDLELINSNNPNNIYVFEPYKKWYSGVFDRASLLKPTREASIFSTIGVQIGLNYKIFQKK